MVLKILEIVLKLDLGVEEVQEVLGKVQNCHFLSKTFDHILVMLDTKSRIWRFNSMATPGFQELFELRIKNNFYIQRDRYPVNDYYKQGY